ncbi:hypothetical protein [Streptomyces graminilatus]|uniref:hypothetical protein n=1 Tax=Streptomyces graminilatus TaxID=1464070 RepID=UPI0006E41B4A|nr:hypothetical protein [Streptomyces graminilatus]
MDISELVSAAKETLLDRDPTGKAVNSVAVETTRSETGWISYANTALVTYHDGETRELSSRDTPLAAALERHADDEAELGVPPVVLPIPLRQIRSDNLVRCEEHPGVHVESLACRWPHNVHGDGPEPQVGHPHRVTD